MNKGMEANLVGLIKKIDELKSEIDKFHPLPKEVEDRIFQKYRLDWNYNSNAIEGNSLNYGETYAFLMHGITASGKPLKDYLDIRGHNEAINYLINLVRNKEELTEAVIRELHKVILVESYETDALTQNGKLTKKTVTLGAYKTVPNHVKTSTGEVHYFASPEETPSKMYDLMNWYRKSRIDKEIHPVVLASIFHHRFSEIHPFDDGNGRLSRLLMNLILMQNNFPPAIVKNKDRNNYYLALSLADSGDTKKFVEYVAEILMNSMEIYLKGARGESIDEPDDLDKEIILLKEELKGLEDRVEKTDTLETKQEILKNSYEKLLIACDENLKKFRDQFFEFNFSYWLFKKESGGSGRSQMNEFNTNIMAGTLQKDTSNIQSKFELLRFKSLSARFNLTVCVDLYFDDFEYALSVNLVEIPSIQINTFAELLIKGLWFKVLPYTEYLEDTQVKQANKIMVKEIIKYIKNSIKVMHG